MILYSVQKPVPYRRSVPRKSCSALNAVHQIEIFRWKKNLFWQIIFHLWEPSRPHNFQLNLRPRVTRQRTEKKVAPFLPLVTDSGWCTTSRWRTPVPLKAAIYPSRSGKENTRFSEVNGRKNRIRNEKSIPARNKKRAFRVGCFFFFRL